MPYFRVQCTYHNAVFQWKLPRSVFLIFVLVFCMAEFKLQPWLMVLLSNSFPSICKSLLNVETVYTPSIVTHRTDCFQQHLANFL